MELKIEKYEKYNLYTYDNKYFEILKKALNNECLVEAEYKNDKRTYVAKIKLDNKTYIFKRFFFKKLSKKLLSLVRKGEALVTLENITLMKNEGMNQLSSIYGCGIYRKNHLIEEQFMLMEYEGGNEKKDYLLIEDFLKKLDSHRRYHGDTNLGNFIIDKNKNIKVIDTQLKKMYWGNYRSHYDMISLRQYFLELPPYPYKKNIFYYYTLLVRKLKGRENKRSN